MKSRARRRFVLAAVLGSTAALAVLSARRPRGKRPPRPNRPARPSPPERPEIEPVPPWTKIHRRLVFAVLLVVCAALSVLAAHEELTDSGFGMTVTGIGGLTVVVWLVAWRRGAWSPSRHHGHLGVTVLCLGLPAGAGSSVVAEVVLAHRGRPVTVEVAHTRGAAGAWDYTLVVPGGSTPLRGRLHTSVEFAAGERFTVLADRGGFVRPMLPEDVDPAFPAAFVLLGAGVLGVTVLRFGFPLGQGRRRVA